MGGDSDLDVAVTEALDTRQWLSVPTIVARMISKGNGVVVENDVLETLDELVEDGRVERDGEGPRGGRYRLRDGDR